MAMADVVDLVLDARAALGEGAIWNRALQRLHWVDISGHRVFTYDPATGENRAADVGQMVGTVVPRVGGGLLLALHEGFATLDLATGGLTLLPRPPEHDPATARFNDGKCDPAGRFWAGTMSLVKGQPLGRLYRLDADGSQRVMLREARTSNGIAWSLDRRTMYYIDTPLMRVDAFDYDDATGAIAGRRPVITIPPGIGRPDGSTLDAEGMLWVAMWDGGRVTRWDPRTGRLLQTIRLPVTRVTSCAFGGPELDILYLTSAREGLTEAQLAAQPLAGGLFRARPGVRGLPAPAYRG
jgi:sugar lactone lactonase YvrE